MVGILFLLSAGCMVPMTRQEHAARYVYSEPPAVVSREAQTLMRQKGYAIVPTTTPSFQTDWHPVSPNEKLRYSVTVQRQGDGCNVMFSGTRSTGGRVTRFPDYDLAYELMIRVDPQQAHRRPMKNTFKSWWRRNTQCTGLML